MTKDLEDKEFLKRLKKVSENKKPNSSFELFG